MGSKLIKGSLQDGRNPQSLCNFSSFQSKMVGLEGEQRFNICKHKFGTPPRSTKNSHRSGRDNFFVPCHCVTMLFTSTQYVVLPYINFSMQVYYRHRI